MLLVLYSMQLARLKDHSMQTTQSIRETPLFTQLVLKGQFIGGKEFHPMNLVRRWVGLCWQFYEGVMIHQHTSAVAIKVRMLLLDGHNNSKQLMFMACIVMGGSSQLFAVIDDWLQPIALILVQHSTNAIV